MFITLHLQEHLLLQFAQHLQPQETGAVVESPLNVSRRAFLIHSVWLKVTSRDCPLSAQWLACCRQLIVLAGHLCQPYRSLAHSTEQSPKSPMHNVTHIWDQDTHSQCNCDSNYPYSTVNSHKWWEHHISGVRIVVGMAHTISLRRRRPPANASLSRLLRNQRYSLTVLLMFAQNIMTLGVLTPFEPCRWPKIKIHIHWSSGLHQDCCLACENKIECFHVFFNQ